MINKVHFIGLGALGSSYAAQVLKKNKNALFAIANGDRAKKLLDQGLVINKIHYSLNVVSHCDSPAELIIVAVKYPELQQALDDIEKFVGPQTKILSLLNGISSEEIIGKRFGDDKVIPAFGIAMDARKEGNNISYVHLGRIVLGEVLNSSGSDRLSAVTEFFKHYDIPYEVPKDMLRAIWFKFMLNTGVNQVSSVLKATFIHFQSDGPAREMMLMAAKEVLAIAQAQKINLTHKDLDVLVETINKLDPNGQTSMLQDLLQKRPTEVDYFSGKIIELGKNLGIPTPVNQFLFHEIKFKETN